MCCQIVQEVVNGQYVADVCGLAAIQRQFAQRCVTSDVAVQIILPSGTKATVSLLTSVRVRTQHSYYEVGLFTVWIRCVNSDRRIKICGCNVSQVK